MNQMYQLNIQLNFSTQLCRTLANSVSLCLSPNQPKSRIITNTRIITNYCAVIVHRGRDRDCTILRVRTSTNLVTHEAQRDLKYRTMVMQGFLCMTKYRTEPAKTKPDET